jgi:hypothetical protein
MNVFYVYDMNVKRDYLGKGTSGRGREKGEGDRVKNNQNKLLHV